MKRFLSILLAVLLIFGTAQNIGFAFDLSQKHEVSWDNILTDADGNAFTWYTGLNAADNPYGF